MSFLLRNRIAFIGLLVFLISANTALQAQPVASEKLLVIGTKEAAPFSIKNDDGTWSGISIDLWKEIADELDLSYEFKETGLDEMLTGVANGSLDLAIAALTITSERESLVDFSHPFYTSGLSIATRQKNSPWTTVLYRFLSVDFLKIVGILSVVLLIFGFLVWFFERKHNPAQFGGKASEGIGSGFWWAAVTMTTVGYGDKAPVTTGGRIVALIWMFAALIIISSFTAAITTMLTVDELGSPIQGPSDLYKVRVGTVEGSTSAEFLKESKIAYKPFDSIGDAMDALHSGWVDALVYDEPILRYLATSDVQSGIKVLKNSFRREYYGIAFPSGSPLIEPVNRSLLKLTSQPEWRDILYEYLGN